MVEVAPSAAPFGTLCSIVFLGSTMHCHTPRIPFESMGMNQVRAYRMGFIWVLHPSLPLCTPQCNGHPCRTRWHTQSASIGRGIYCPCSALTDTEQEQSPPASQVNKNKHRQVLNVSPPSLCTDHPLVTQHLPLRGSVSSLLRATCYRRNMGNREGPSVPPATLPAGFPSALALKKAFPGAGGAL